MLKWGVLVVSESLRNVNGAVQRREGSTRVLMWSSLHPSVCVSVWRRCRPNVRRLFGIHVTGKHH